MVGRRTSTLARGSVIEERYRLEDELGSGTSGSIFRASDLRTGERRAVKVLHDDLSQNPLLARRFAREVDSAKSIQHPNVVRVAAAGRTADGRLYLVMELVEGTSLADVLKKEGALPLARTIDIAAQVLDAVAAAHRLSIVHRDLKPSNILMTATAERRDLVKVCDFGLAKAIRPDDETDSLTPHASSLTLQGQLCGTPAYMSPEQAQCEPLDGRTDLYSVAVMLFEMVTGSLPFNARSPMALISRHLTEAPPRPTQVRPDALIPPALENLILRGLAKDRSERPSSADVFRAELLQIGRDAARLRGALSSGQTPAVPSPRLLRRRRLQLGAAVLLMTGATAGTLAVRARRAPAPPEVALRPPAPRALVAVPPPPAQAAAPAPPPAVAAAPPAPTTPPREAPPEKAPLARLQPRRARPPKVAPAPSATAPAATAPAAPVVAAVPAPAAAEPPSVKELLDAAEALLGDGRVAQACAAGEKARAAAPTAAAVYKFLGRCYMRADQTTRATENYRRYLELAPDAPDARFVRFIVEKRP
jgi:serine/threonine-protein kinase